MSKDIIHLSRAQVVALGPCSTSKIPRFGLHKTMSARQALEAGATIPDLLWVASKLGRRDLCVTFALRCAQRVSHLNTDRRVQAALDATQAWLDNPCKETANAATNAAYAATNAAYAATNAATNADTNASYASYAASNAAVSTYAPYTASCAATYNAAYAAKSRTEEKAEQRRIFLEIFDRS